MFDTAEIFAKLLFCAFILVPAMGAFFFGKYIGKLNCSEQIDDLIIVNYELKGKLIQKTRELRNLNKQDVKNEQ